MRNVWMALSGLLLLLVIGLSVWIGRTPADQKLAGRERIIVQLQWEPGAQFMGFYVANAKNYYAEEGLSVEFLHAGPGIDPLRAVERDAAQIGLATADQVLIRADANKAPDNALKVVGTVFNRNLVCFMSKESIPLGSPTDLIGKTVGVFPSYDTENILLSLLNKHNVSAEAVKLFNFPNMAQFNDDTVQILGSYLINEPLIAKQKGMKVSILDPHKLGVVFYSDAIVTKGTYYKAHKDTIRKFLRASARGWSFVEGNPQQSLNLMFQEVRGAIGEGEPQQVQADKRAELVKYLRDGPSDKLFYMRPATWDSMETSLFQIGRISRTGHVESLCDFAIVDEAMP